MKKLSIFIFVFLISHLLIAQHKKGQFEIALPLHPWTALSSSYYAQFEYHHSTRHATTAVIGYQATAFWFAYFSKIENYKGQRADIGHRWYLLRGNTKYLRPFVGVNVSIENSFYKLKPGFGVPIDSLQTKGLSIGPEINAGLKLVLFKRLTIAPSLGLRYYVNTHNTKKITNNPTYWRYDDWDNGYLKWEDNRSSIDDFRDGFLPVPYINVGFMVKL